MAFDLSRAKELYGSIFKVFIGDPPESIYFRPVTKGEYRTFLELNEGQDTINFNAEQYLISRVILEPTLEHLDQILYAGEAQTLVLKILEHSGFVNYQEFVTELMQQRQAMQTLGEQVVAFIAKALPIYKLEELDHMNSKQLAHLLAVAELIMGEPLDVPGADPQETPIKKKLLANPDLKAISENDKQLVETTRQRQQDMMNRIKQR